MVTRVALVGTRGSAKTTVAGFLVLTAYDLGAKSKEFLIKITEGYGPGFSSEKSEIFGKPEIRSVALTYLRKGRFPPPTEYKIFESKLQFQWSKKWIMPRFKTVDLPIVETSGEVIQRMISRFAEGKYDMPDIPHASDILENLWSSNGFIILLPVNRQLLFEEGGTHVLEINRPPYTQDVEPETIDENPDVNISRLLEAIRNFKEEYPEPELNGLALVLTKCDIVNTFLMNQGIDLGTESGKLKFLHTYLPGTYAELKAMKREKEIFIVSSWVKLARTNGELELDKDNRPKIKIKRPKARPDYSVGEYEKLITWIKDVF